MSSEGWVRGAALEEGPSQCSRIAGIHARWAILHGVQVWFYAGPVNAETAVPLEGRREKNKVATRAAITAAALRLAREQGPGGFTVDQVAAEAGVSRRTFFNYFPSIEAAVTLPVEEFLEESFARLDERSADEPIMDAVLATLGGDISQERLALLCEIYQMGADDAQLERIQLQIWRHAQQSLEDGLRRRLPESAGELTVTALAGSLIACAQAAMRMAATQTPDGEAPGPSDFRQQLLESLDLLRTGFNINHKD
jgi:AcrR family transcriptional regulator